MYGDPAYPLRAHLQGRYKGAVLTLHQQQFTKSMSSARVSVESVFNDIIKCFKFLGFKKNLKVGLNAVGRMYIVCTLIQNAYTILYGSVTSEYFGINPPALDDYFILIVAIRRDMVDYE